jgi:hypothetical protein
MTTGNGETAFIWKLFFKCINGVAFFSCSSFLFCWMFYYHSLCKTKIMQTFYLALWGWKVSSHNFYKLEIVPLFNIFICNELEGDGRIEMTVIFYFVFWILWILNNYTETDNFNNPKIKRKEILFKFFN